MTEALDHARMGTALALARRAMGQTWPNPSVGCVIGRERLVFGHGYTQPGGRPHAEQMALAQARERFGEEALRGATAWLTLEPCAHRGRTPPCADALAAAGIGRVVAALPDPDPRTDGNGFARLRAAGIIVEVGLRAEEARALHAGFLARLTRRRPWLTLKLATSLDGRIATADGESRWITGPQARARVHLMRAEADAVLIGSGTARADDPLLDVRLPGLAARSPVRVVLDRSLSLPPASRMEQTALGLPFWILHAPKVQAPRRAALVASGARPIAMPLNPDGALDLAACLDGLASLGITQVLCEGGATLAAALLRADLVDEIAWFAAGLALGAEGTPAVGSLGLMNLADARRFTLTGTEMLGGDTLSVWRRTIPPLAVPVATTL
jgi:diaminohydroxyphosphoribosylaminopyrimidine deaminase/5-amino-6-(5-phosphoribosylamino)uracil reductase